MSERVIYIVRSWPRLSQTFILDEVLALERRGLELAVFSLARARNGITQPHVDDVRAPVQYLEDQLAQRWVRRARLQLTGFAASPLRYLRTLWFCLRHPGLAAGYGECSTLQCFLHAVRIIIAMGTMRTTGRRPLHVHAHFAHDPALVGMLVARLSGLPFSFTAHARDLYQIPESSLVARCAEATALVTCCRANAEYIAAVVPASVRPPVRIIHHGVDLHRFRVTDQRSPGRALRLVSVGRLVEKKGYVDLLRALAAVSAGGVDVECQIYGDGPLREQLAGLRDSLGLTGRVRLMGAQPTARIVAALADTDAFVLASRVTADGDRDGIPNVLVEAMACGLPVATTTAGGITELVRHEENGLLSTPGDVAQLALSVHRLLVDPALRRRLGTQARHTVERHYSADVAAQRLEQVLRPVDSPLVVGR